MYLFLVFILKKLNIDHKLIQKLLTQPLVALIFFRFRIIDFRI